jgi:hypothetical protein
MYEMVFQLKQAQCDGGDKSMRLQRDLSGGSH